MERDFLFLEGDAEAYSEKVTALISEIKNLINVIMTSTELLRMGLSATGDKLCLSHCDSIESAALQLTGITGDISARTAFQTGSSCLNPSLFSMNELIDDIAEKAAYYLSQKHIDLTVSAELKNPSVTADKSKIARALLILIANSSKNTDSNGHIKISASENGKMVEITVTDNGRKPEGDPFTEKMLGTENFSDYSNGSLRMSVVKIICLAHGGRVSAETADGFNIYKVTLPRLHKDSANILSEKVPEQPDLETAAKIEFLSAGF